jgi:hypothetical protein
MAVGVDKPLAKYQPPEPQPQETEAMRQARLNAEQAYTAFRARIAQLTKQTLED